MMKYRNKKTCIDGFTFDSRKEARRYTELKSLQMAGEISMLELQVRFPLEVNGQKICDYVADFVYMENGMQVVEDVKSEATSKLPIYRIKKKLMRAIHDIDIVET